MKRPPRVPPMKEGQAYMIRHDRRMTRARKQWSRGVTQRMRVLIQEARERSEE